MGAELISGRGDLHHTVKSITFTGGAGLGAIGTFALFTVTGEIEVVRLVPYCSDSVTDDAAAGIASMQLGVTNDTDLFVVSTQADTILTGLFWMDGTPTGNGMAIPVACKEIAITQNIVGQVTSTGVQLVNGGTLEIDLWWRPLSANGNVT